MAKSILYNLIFIVVLAVPPVLLTLTSNTGLLVPHFWVMFAFVSFLTFVAVVFVLNIQRVNNEMYAAAFLGATTFKILLCLVFILIFIRKNHPEKLVFVGDFMYLYLLNTVFEVYGLLRNLRNQNLK